jgi:GTP cyclohydrolase I
MMEQIRDILLELEYDIKDPNFKETPLRIEKWLTEYKKPNSEEISEFFEKKFPTNYSGMIVQKGIKTWGMCPHHLKDVEYEISFGIIYNSDAMGLSKFTRLFERLSKQLILQEELTHQIVKTLEKNLKPKGIALVLKGFHGCMACRGVKQKIPTITSIVTGPFLNDEKCRQEFFNHINSNN